MMNDMLKAASWYRQKGFSVIPIKPGDKKPLIRWEAYQKKRATDAEVRDWFTRWPNANIGLVTGAISGIAVVDVDSDAGKEALAEFMPDTLVMPTCTTPSGGCHHYFAHRPGLVNRARVITDCDVRTCGGYVVAPPSKNGKGSYTWMPGLKINEIDPPAMPDFLFDVLSQGGPPSSGLPSCPNINTNMHLKGGTRGENPEPGITKQTNHNKHNIKFSKGSRDESLFHVARCLAKGGMEKNNALECLKVLGASCDPEFPEKEIVRKVESAFSRIENSKRNLTAELREWISITWDNISITDALQNITNITSADRPKITVIMNRFVKEGLLERVPGRNGIYRKVDADCDHIDFENADDRTVDLWLPFNIHHFADIMPGNIIVVGGSPNSGKTGLFLNILQANQDKFECHYFSSEMGGAELKKRLALFDDMTLGMWKFKAWERSSNFGDVVKSGEGKLNVVDFLEVYDNFYEIGGKLAEIHRKLKGALCIVGIQKNRGADLALGGFRSLEKPRLYLSMDAGTLKIVKCKNWRGNENPNGKQVNFKIVSGCKFIQTKGWHHPAP